MKKILITITLLIGMLLMILGISIQLSSSKESSKAEPTTNETEELTEKEIDEIYDIERNESKNIKKEHCLNNICISSMEIINQYDDIMVVSGEITNKSASITPAGYIKIVFQLEEKQETLMFYYNAIESNKTIPLELQHQKKELVTATDYTIEIPTQDEINEYFPNNQNQQ